MPANTFAQNFNSQTFPFSIGSPTDYVLYGQGGQDTAAFYAAGALCGTIAWSAGVFDIFDANGSVVFNAVAGTLYTFGNTAVAASYTGINVTVIDTIGGGGVTISSVSSSVAINAPTGQAVNISAPNTNITGTVTVTGGLTGIAIFGSSACGVNNGIYMAGTGAAAALFDYASNQLLTTRQAAPGAPTLAAPSANETALLNYTTALVNVLKIHGLIH